MAQGLLDDRAGWLALYGPPGSGKSAALRGLVADLCRSGVRAVYLSGRDLTDRLFRDLDSGASSGGAELDYLGRCPALVVDDLDGAHVRSDFVAGALFDLFDRRYRAADRRVTAFALNADPAAWFHSGGLWAEKGPAILSRLGDGRFSRPWPAGVAVPQALAGSQVVPALLPVDGPDIRPFVG